jgi:DNA-directed RNA polymerase specialized sigma24 family protein
MDQLSLYMHLYQQKLLKKKELEEFVFQFVLKNPHRFYIKRWGKEQRIDYLCWLYPKWSAAIDAYKDTGSSFEAYLASLMFWSAREYFVSEGRHSITEQVCWEEQTKDILIREQEEEYAAETVHPFRNETGKHIKTKEILILLLKSYSFISEDFLRRVAPVVGIEADRLRRMIDTLKKRREVHDEGIRTLKRGIHSQYYRCLAFERRLYAMDRDCPYYERTKEVLERGRKRLANMKKRLAGLRVDASNRQVAEILHIPKGTVDSTLYLIKKKFGIMESRR